MKSQTLFGKTSRENQGGTGNMVRKVMNAGWKLIAVFALALVLVLGLDGLATPVYGDDAG